MQIFTIVSFQYKNQRTADFSAVLLSKHLSYKCVNTVMSHRPLIERCLNVYGSRRKPGPFGFSKTKFVVFNNYLYNKEKHAGGLNYENKNQKLSCYGYVDNVFMCVV